MSAGGAAQFIPSVGARFYRHQHFGDAWAPQAGLVAKNGPWQAHASFSRAMNFPGLEVAAFSTVAIPALGQSWRTLRPERLDQTEAGLRYELTVNSAVELTLFRNRAHNRFVFVPPPPPPFRFVNIEQFRTQGGELTLGIRPAKGVSLFGGVSRLETSPIDLPYAPRWSLVGGATWKITRAWRLNVDGSYVSAQNAAAQARAGGALNTERVPPYALLNGRLAYGFTGGALVKSGEVFFAVENLFDRAYRYRPGYPLPGTGFTLGLNAEL
jgi:iron complex outermembrane receptor protein